MDDRQPFEEDIAARGAPASPDALRSIVAKHQRARTRTLGIFLAVALVAGPIAGWAIGNSGGGGTQVATGSNTDKSNGASPAAANAPGSGGGASGQAFAYPDKNPPKATHLFNRTSSDGIAIRAYRTDPPAPPANATTPTTSPSGKTEPAPCPMPMTVKPGTPGGVQSGAASSNSNSGSATASASASSGESGVSSPGGAPDAGPPVTAINGAPPPCPPPPPPCNPTPSVLAEVSNDAAVGQGFDPIDDKQPSEPLSHLSVNAFGVPENSSAMFVTVQTGPGVATVRLRLPSGATDEMTPSGGVAVLAHGSEVPPAKGTVVEALDGSGKVLASQDVSEQSQKPMVACGGIAGPVRAFQAPAPTPAPTPPTTR